MPSSTRSSTIERANRFIRRLHPFDGVVVLDVEVELGASIADPPTLFGVTLQPPQADCAHDPLFADQIPPFTDEELADLAHIDHP